MQAVEPVRAGQVRLAEFQVSYETYGDEEAPVLLLLPAWQIVSRRMWKMQVAYFSRAYHVITFDGPRRRDDEQTADSRAFEYERIVDQGIGLLDYLGIERASLIGFSRGSSYAMLMAARYPERVRAAVLITNGVTPDTWGTPIPHFRERRESYEGWEKYNLPYWREHYDDFLEFFFGEIFSEPYSTKPTEDCIAWARETTPEILGRTENDPSLMPKMPVGETLGAITCPVLMIHGDDARCTPLHCSLELSTLRDDWPMVILEGSGQAPHVRDPVRVNLLVAAFLENPAAAQPTPGCEVAGRSEVAA
jgi:pimeloyl-ACP methyl ester carboxylesterase